MAAQLLYLRGLRRYMDYTTGIVGKPRKVSWQGLGEVLEVEAHQGMGGERFTKGQLRRLVEWLVKRGLVEDRDGGASLLFFLPLADLDDSDQKKAVPKPYPSRTTKAEPQERVVSICSATQKPESNGISRTQAVPPDFEKAVPHPGSGIREEEQSSPERERGKTVARGARLSLSVIPDDWLLFAKAERPDLDAQRTWEIFRDHWAGIPGQKGCKTDWFATWRNWVRREDNHNHNHGANNGPHRESSAARWNRLNDMPLADLAELCRERADGPREERVVIGEVVSGNGG